MDIRTEVDRDRQKDRGTRALSCVGKLIAICSTYMKSAGRIENVEESVLKKKKFFLTFCSLSDLASVCLLKQFPLLRYGLSFELLSFKLGLMSTAAVLQQSLLYISTVLHLGLLSITWDCWALSTWVMSLECFIQGHSLTFKEKGRLLPV